MCLSGFWGSSVTDGRGGGPHPSPQQARGTGFRLRIPNVLCYWYLEHSSPGFALKDSCVRLKGLVMQRTDSSQQQSHPPRPRTCREESSVSSSSGLAVARFVRVTVQYECDLPRLECLSEFHGDVMLRAMGWTVSVREGFPIMDLGVAGSSVESLVSRG